MQIRSAHEHEASILSLLAMESKAHWRYSAAQLARWREDLTVSRDTISSFPVHVAELEGRIAGFYVLDPTPSHWSLEHFWVSPASMHRGVGRTLLNHAAGLAADGGAAAIAIDADPNAEPFYRACGARRVGSIPAPIEGDPARRRPQLLLPVRPTGCLSTG